MYYYSNGITTKELLNDELFYFNTPYSDNRKEYWFNNDSILYQLDSLCVELFDKFLYKIFDNVDQYYDCLDLLPIWVSQAGLNSDFTLSKNTFGELVNKSKVDDLNKHLYLADCQSMISSLQNSLSNMNWSFIHFYIYLSELKPFNISEDGVFFLQSQEVSLVYSMINNYIISAYSCFDLLTKIAYEFENLVSTFNSYPKLKSIKKLYGDKKDLQTINTQGTVFEATYVINIIINLRNELIHNGSWEQHQKVFYEVKNGEIIEKYIYLPDNDDGILHKFKNRKRFFENSIKLNYELPEIYKKLLNRIENTIVKLG